MTKQKDSGRVPDLEKVNGNRQNAYTGCQYIITDFKAKKEVNALCQGNFWGR